MTIRKKEGAILFDWGDTLMRTLPDYKGPMCGWPRVEMIPHADSVLSQLQPSWTLALASNAADSGQADIRAALERVGLNERIERIFCFAEMGLKKTDPAFFEHLLEDLQLDRSRVVMVGDDFETDVLGAIDAGLSAIWFNPNSDETHGADRFLTIHDLRSLPRAIWNLMEKGPA